MKKILLTLALAAFAMTASAQWVLGGNIGLNHDGDHDDNYTGAYGSYARTSITVMPKIGYWLNDNMQIGANLGWNYFYSRTYGGASDSYWSHPQSSVVIAPYLRYNVATWRNFTVFCEAQLNFTLGLKSKTHTFVNGTETIADQNDNFTSFGINVVPGLNYAFTDKISMDVYINLIGLYANMTTGDGWKDHNMGLGIDMAGHTLNNHLNNFTIGFNYAL